MGKIVIDISISAFTMDYRTSMPIKIIENKHALQEGALLNKWRTGIFDNHELKSLLFRATPSVVIILATH